MRDILGQVLMQHSMGLADGVWVRVRCGVDEGCVKIVCESAVAVNVGRPNAFPPENPVQSAALSTRVDHMSQQNFNQPPSETFSIYDAGAPKRQPDLSTPLKKAVIDLENEIRHDVLETGAVFDAFGVMLLRKQGLPDQISLTYAEARLLQGNTFTHNHPKGTTFSIADVQRAIEWDIKEMRVVTALLRYSIKSNDCTWPSLALVLTAVHAAKQGATRRVNDAVRSGELHPQFAEAEYLHYIWIEVANRLNLQYQRERS
jgi:hypothetical protein